MDGWMDSFRLNGPTEWTNGMEQERQIGMLERQTLGCGFVFFIYLVICSCSSKELSLQTMYVIQVMQNVSFLSCVLSHLFVFFLGLSRAGRGSLQQDHFSKRRGSGLFIVRGSDGRVNELYVVVLRCWQFFDVGKSSHACRLSIK